MTTDGDQVSTTGPVVVSREMSWGRLAGLVCLVVVLLVAGCAGGSDGRDEVVPQLSVSPVPAASPAGSAASPAGSGSARDQQIAAGAEAIRAYRQMIFDIYADPNPNVQDMRKVATGGKLKRDLQGVRRGLADGWRDTSGTVSIKWVKPVSVGRREMRLFACVDPNDIQVRRGNDPAKPARREAADYVLVRQQDNWLVSGIFTHVGAKGAKSC